MYHTSTKYETFGLVPIAVILPILTLMFAGTEDVFADPFDASSWQWDPVSGALAPTQAPSCVDPADLSRHPAMSPSLFDITDGSTAPPPTPQAANVGGDKSITSGKLGAAIRSQSGPVHLAPSEDPADCGKRAKELADGREQCQRKDAATDPAKRRSSLAEDVVGARVSRTDVCRARNKVAAQKCRAKKRRETEGLQERYREFAAENSLLIRQERELRTALLSLREFGIQHGPPRCQCHSLHDFNIRQAARIGRRGGSLVSE